jgi:hypothetical protein
MNLLFAFELISFVSRPDNGQIAFQNRARLLVTETFFDAFFDRVQTTFSSYLSQSANFLGRTGNLFQSGSGQHLPQMLRDEFCHLEHTHLALAIEYRPQ